MKKIYRKKDLPIEESPLTLQLQRRHTVVEGDKDKSPVASKLKPISRSNSTSSIYNPPRSAKGLNSRKGFVESKLSADSSGSSLASAVVITESQLSSSLLYNNKKAQMCPKETLSAGESFSEQAPDNQAECSNYSQAKSVLSRNRNSRRFSSCCCYTTIIILVGLAVIGVISAVGGIAYMEFFSATNKTETGASGLAAIGRSEDLSYANEDARSLDVGDNPTSHDEEISVSLPESKQDLEILNRFKGTHINDRIGNRHVKSSGNILRVKKTKDITTTEDETSSSIHVTNKPLQRKDSNDVESFKKSNVSSTVPQNNSPYSKLFELYKGIHSMISEATRPSEKTSVPDLNPKITDFVENISNFSEESEFEKKDNIKSHKNLPIFDSNNSVKDSLKQELDLNSESNLSTHKEVSQPAIPKYFFRVPSKETGIDFRNTFVSNEGSDIDNSDVQPSAETQHHLPQISILNNDSNDNVDSNFSLNNQEALLHSKESINTDTDSALNANHIPSGKVSGPAIPKNFFQIPTKDAAPVFRNMLDINEEGEDGHLEEINLPRFLPHIPELSDNDDGDKDSIASDLDLNDKELPLELNRPVSEAKIAVPGPLDLIRRFASGIETDNKEKSDQDKHDRSYFLAQALERLRTLDVRNILPSSRRKTSSIKSPKQKLEPKVQSEQEVVTERSSYLQKLRRHFFEK